MSTFYTFLLASQPKSALNDHGNKDIGDKLYCISVSAQIHQCKGSRERFLPNFTPCQYSNPQRATRLTQTWAMAPTDMQILTRLMFIYLLPCLIPPLQIYPKVTEFHKIPSCCQFVETVPVPFVLVHVSLVPSERFSCDGFLLNRLQASWMLHILDTCPPSYSPHRHPNPKHFSMMCTWTHMPSSSASANSSLQTNIEIGNETNTSNPHNINQQENWASLRKTSSQQKTVSWSPTIHLSQCAGGCGFALAPHLNSNFSHQSLPYTANFSGSAFHWASPDHSPNPSL